MPSAVIVDSGPFIALFDRDDAFHKGTVEFLAGRPAMRLQTTWAVLNETCALLGSRVGRGVDLDFLGWVRSADIGIAPHGKGTLAAIEVAMRKYRDLPLDFADASVAVLAAEAGMRQILTLDRDFDVYRDARGKRLRNLLAPVIAAVR